MANLLEKISAAFTRKQESAKEKYYAALLKGDAAAAVAVSADAGVTPEQVAAHAEVIEMAARLAAVAREHPELAKKLGEADAAYDKVTNDFEAAKIRFLAEFEVVNEALGAAMDAEKPSRKAVAELANLTREHPDLLPIASAPEPVKKLLSEQDREAEIGASRERVRNARSAAFAIERQLTTARNERRTPGVVSTISGFNLQTMKHESKTITQPVIAGVDDKHVAGEQANITQLENQLAAATKSVETLASAHEKKFAEQVR